MISSLPIPALRSADLAHPVIVSLLDVIRQQDTLLQHQVQTIEALKGEIQRLRDEIAHLKGHSPKPKIRPSSLEPGGSKESTQEGGSRPGSAKRPKTAVLEIHATQYIVSADFLSGGLTVAV